MLPAQPLPPQPSTIPSSPQPPPTALPAAPATGNTTVIQTQAEKQKQYDLNIAELLFAVSSYCYIRSSQLAYESLNNLNPALVVILKEFVLQTQKEEQKLQDLEKLEALLRNENKASADFATSYGVDATIAPQVSADSEEEPETPIATTGIPS